MAGEIRNAMARLKEARAKMVSDLTAEVDAVIVAMEQARAHGLDVMKLPRAELASYQDEIQQIQSEFSALTNGPPASPLPNSSTMLVGTGGPAVNFVDNMGNQNLGVPGNLTHAVAGRSMK